jgi:hypothetical protein
MLTDKQKYFHLLAEVCEKMPVDAVDTAIRRDHPTPAHSLGNVRIGRKVDLPALVQLIELSMPDYDIPAELRPAA